MAACEGNLRRKFPRTTACCDFFFFSLPSSPKLGSEREEPGRQRQRAARATRQVWVQQPVVAAVQPVGWQPAVAVVADDSVTGGGGGGADGVEPMLGRRGPESRDGGRQPVQRRVASDLAFSAADAAAAASPNAVSISSTLTVVTGPLSGLAHDPSTAAV